METSDLTWHLHGGERHLEFKDIAIYTDALEIADIVDGLKAKEDKIEMHLGALAEPVRPDGMLTNNQWREKQLAFAEALDNDGPLGNKSDRVHRLLTNLKKL